MKITKKYLQKLIEEEISNQIVDVKESIEQDEWEKDVLDCAKGDICRLNDDVVGPDGSTFEIAVAAKKKDLGLVGSTASAVKTRAQKLAKISSLREARLETIIREEAAALLAEEKMYQIGGPEYRAQTGVATPAEKFGIVAKDIMKGLDTQSIWSMADKGHYKGDSGTFRKQGRAMKHLLGIIKSYRKADEPAVFAQSGYDINMVPGTGIHSSFDLRKLPAERSDRYATIKKLIATIQKLEAAAAKTAEKPAEPNPETQPALGQDVAVNEGAESNAGAVIAMVLANKRLMKLLGPEAKSIISAVKEGGQLSLLVNLCTNGLVCPDGSDATDRHNRPRCKRTKLNPELDKNLLLTTLEKIKNFESDQAGDARAAEMSLMHGLEEGAVPGEISAEDLTAAITLAIDEVFQEHRPNREAAAEAYANIMESIDAIFRESYAASVRASKMMGAETGFEDLDV